MDEKFNDQILDYLNGHLEDAEKSAFEVEMNQNPILAEEVDLYINLYDVHEVIGEEDLTESIQLTAAELEQGDFFQRIEKELITEQENKAKKISTNEPIVKDLPTSKFSRRNLLSLAASILLLMAIGSWWATTCLLYTSPSPRDS